MGINEKIETCYAVQAKTLLKGVGPDGIKVEQAASLFSVINLNGQPEGAKRAYLQGIDTDGNGSISEKELTEALERADKEGRTGNNPNDRMARNNQIVDSLDIESDFAKNGSIPFLLAEAKKQNPAKYEQIKQRLMSGAFTVTDESSKQDINLLKQQTDGRDYATAVNTTAQRYEAINSIASQLAPTPQAQKAFFDDLASGQVPKFGIGRSADQKYTMSFYNDVIEDKAFLGKSIVRKARTFDIANSEKITNTDSSFDSRISLNTQAPATFDNDPLEKAAAKKLCTDAMSDKQLQYYDEHVLEAMENPKKFGEFMDKIGKDVRKSLNVNVPQKISDQQEGSAIAFYDRKDKDITVSYTAIKSIQEEMEKTGTPKDKMKQELLRETLGVLSHEYWHAKQADLIQNTPANASSEEKAIIKQYEENYQNGISIEKSVKLFGTREAYTKQPVEKSAYDMSMDVNTHIDHWYAKRNQTTP